MTKRTHTTQHEVDFLRTLSIDNPEAFRKYAALVLCGCRQWDAGIDAADVQSTAKRLLDELDGVVPPTSWVSVNSRICSCGRPKFSTRERCARCGSRETKRAWQQANRDKVRESNKRWRSKNPEKDRAAAKRRRLTPEGKRKQSERAKAWRARHPEKVREHQLRWNERRKAKRAGGSQPHISLAGETG